jgi:hypothetical protein
MEPTPEQFTEWLEAAVAKFDWRQSGLIAGEVARLAYAAGAQGAGAARRTEPPTLAQACAALDALTPEYVRGDNPHINTLAAFLNSLPYE